MILSHRINANMSGAQLLHALTPHDFEGLASEAEQAEFARRRVADQEAEIKHLKRLQRQLTQENAARVEAVAAAENELRAERDRHAVELELLATEEEILRAEDAHDAVTAEQHEVQLGFAQESHAEEVGEARPLKARLEELRAVTATESERHAALESLVKGEVAEAKRSIEADFRCVLDETGKKMQAVAFEQLDPDAKATLATSRRLASELAVQVLLQGSPTLIR